MVYTNILHIDDDPDDCEMLAYALEKAFQGKELTSICNPVQALQQLEKKEVQPDVIFLDINMPVMGGMELLSRLKQNQELNSIPVIVLSTASDAEIVKKAKALGADNFISKPTDLHNFIALLKAL